MSADLRYGAFAPQGWKLEYNGWPAADAWTRTKELAQLTEQLGYHHLWVYDHFETVPTREPTHVFEAFTTLSALAQHTSTIKLGQLVTCAAYRNAGVLAKEAACVDVYSGGRLILGLGAGWYDREYQAYGYPYLGAGTRLFGTIDGKHVEAAGKVGFHPPQRADPAQYQKLVDMQEGSVNLIPFNDKGLVRPCTCDETRRMPKCCPGNASATEGDSPPGGGGTGVAVAMAAGMPPAVIFRSSSRLTLPNPLRAS